ncbi:DNA/RNA nuclease SfsA [Desulfoferrobacter suflitae]|uniref:DNA/RNA nuclease SfsA n=1 Tax=Desulfoferrobacter suflitae TaxID=2865782 RepID=UPI002164C810|nr:DNA/RNA nuclease SfsA [Desulfoferrobacter suflitae]MCK8602971.1 DNA/RNA nuclease SfsA [Desulfoferrobacter suflitae]
MIKFPDGCLTARFCRREKRFLVEVERQNARFWVHCNNSGSMLGLLRRGADVLLSPGQRPGRRLSHTLELIKLGDAWVGVNTLTPNRMLRKAWEMSLIPQLRGYSAYRSEAKVGSSRLDARLTGADGALWIEAKNVTLVEDEVAYFPDAPTERGRKHLLELMELARSGQRVACFYLIQRPEARCFAPADFIDSTFADLFWQALDAGVEAWPYQALISTEGIRLGAPLPLAIAHKV